MREVGCSLLVGALLAACSAKPPAAVQVALNGAQFGTTGGNLFNCGSPAEPATFHSLSPTVIACDPGRAADGTLATQPATNTQIIGCGDGQGAVVTVTCAGTGVGNEVTGTVTIAIAPSCSSTDQQSDPQTFAFQNVAPGASQSSAATLESCAVFDNLCNPSNACAFNSFAADISVTNTSQ